MPEKKFILEGMETTEDPSLTKIDQELNYLKNKRSEFVILSSGSDFIQLYLKLVSRTFYFINRI